ncbi:PadR family transcriptional regulator [Actinoplanes italicus]|uniref:PadR family transcriptional regulator n=1 Tax=Actinoplanes italicus TaxID=113567 RepID=A0A2T0JYB2_9ACTN|nr:PadR family transcriptional regulator [Actinoplanes italicus]PRX13854.1 PadR family transcriptional regulator [Actinoplanes italicus]
MTMDATLSGHLQELRRGTVVVASLTVLREPGYGYSLLETLSAAGFEVEANTLYPLLRRLESQGLLTSSWNTDEARPRKFYRTTEQGDAIAAALRGEWMRLDKAIGDLDTPDSGPGGDAADGTRDHTPGGTSSGSE